MSKMLSGTYKIIYKSGQIGAARFYHPTQSSRIFVDESDKGDSSKWRVAAIASSDTDIGWRIRNLEFDDFLFAVPKPGARLIGRENTDDHQEIVWDLETVGQDTYRICYPNTDLAWTAVLSPVPGRKVYEIFLQNNTEGTEQEFKFVLLSSG